MGPVSVDVGGAQRDISVRERWVLWHITRRCNIECSYCYGSFSGQSYKTLGRDPAELSPERCVRLLFELSECGFDAVHINGGEPLTRGDLEGILTRARSSTVRKWLLTNGTIRGRVFDAISTDGLVDVFGVSLDSNLPKINEVARERTTEARKSLEVLADRKRSGTLSCKLAVYVVLSQHALQQFESYVDWLVELGVDYVNLQPVYLPAGHSAASMSIDERNRDRFQEAFDYLAAHIVTSDENMRWLSLRTVGGVVGEAQNCFADRGDYLYVSPSGLVYGCPVKASGTVVAAGNLHRQTMASIVRRERPVRSCSHLCGDCLGMYEMASGPSIAADSSTVYGVE